MLAHTNAVDVDGYEQQATVGLVPQMRKQSRTCKDDGI